MAFIIRPGEPAKILEREVIMRFKIKIIRSFTFGSDHIIKVISIRTESLVGLGHIAWTRRVVFAATKHPIIEINLFEVWVK